MKFRIFSWLSSVVIAAALGWFCRGPGVGGDSPKSHLPLQPPQTVARAANATGTVPQADAPASSSPPGGDYRLRLRTAFASKDPYARVRLVLEQLEHTTASNVEDLRNTWREYLASGMPKYALDYFINRSIAQAMGAGALTGRTGSQADFVAIGAVGNEIEGAMLSDPKGVRNWYDSLTNEGFREALLGPYVSALARSDRQAAMEVMDKLPAEFQQKCAGAIIGNVKSSGGAQAVFDWVKTTLSSPAAAAAPWAGPMFEQAVSQTSGNRQGAVLCAAFLEEVAGESYASMNGAANVAHRYAQMSPIEALEWSARMSGKQAVDSPSLTLSALQGTADGDLNQAAEWCLKNLTGTTRDAAATALLSRSPVLDPGMRAELEKLSPPNPQEGQ